MNYRTVHDGQKVLTSIVQDSNTVTSSNEQFCIDTIERTMKQLAGDGINISYFWKNGLVGRPVPDGQEVAISPHPNDSNVKRKVFVHSMPVDQNSRSFRLNLIIRHFDQDDNHIPDQHEDLFYSSLADENKIVQPEGVGEYTYFQNLINGGANMFDLQVGQIPIMDILGRFNYTLYQ